MFGPVAVVAGGGVRLGEEGAVASVLGFDEGDVGIGGDRFVGLGGDADEGVVEGVEDQRGDGDAVQHARGGGAGVVVFGAGEAGVERGDAVVEGAHGVDAGGAVAVVGAGEERGLAAEAAEESAEEFELVEAVDGAVEGVGGGAEVYRGRDADGGAELGRCGGAEVADELEDEIAAHRVADQRDGFEGVALDEEAQDGEDVVGQAGVVEGGGEGFGAAAVAHVHADDVRAALPELVCVADDVLRVGGAFEAVDDDGGGAGGADIFGLPVAVAEDLAGDLAGGGGRDFDELLFGGREGVGAGEIVAGDGLQVAVGEIAAGLEVFDVRGDGFKGFGLGRGVHQAFVASA